MVGKKVNLTKILKYWPVLLVLAGLFYRLNGLEKNFSFWADEEHVAIFSRAILERGQPILTNGYSTGVYQWLQYWLSAISAKILGLNELGIRFPSVIFGALTIGLVYVMAREWFDLETGMVAALLTAFLRIEILWSRQARPYQGVQFFYLSAAWFIYRLEKKFHWPDFLGLITAGVLASLMHGLGLVIFAVGLGYLFLFSPIFRKNRWLLPTSVLLLIFSFFLRQFLVSVFSQLGRVNNLFYYRVFLWHNYRPLLFLAASGLLCLIWLKKTVWRLPIVFLVVQGVLVSFFLGQPFLRYFYPVFPFLILFSAFGLVQISRFLVGKLRLRQNLGQYSILVLLLLLVLSGKKFALLNPGNYSLNEDMQEVPEVDWSQVYRLVGEKLVEDQKIILMTNWNDLPVWYLGEGKLDGLIRRPQENLPTKDPLSGAKIITSLAEMKEIIGNGKGILVLDSWDDQVPDGVREYAESYLKKEFFLDRLYPVQPRFWPVRVYSWGGLN